MCLFLTNIKTKGECSHFYGFFIAMEIPEPQVAGLQINNYSFEKTD